MAGSTGLAPAWACSTGRCLGFFGIDPKFIMEKVSPGELHPDLPAVGQAPCYWTRTATRTGIEPVPAPFRGAALPIELPNPRAAAAFSALDPLPVAPCLDHVRAIQGPTMADVVLTG